MDPIMNPRDPKLYIYSIENYIVLLVLLVLHGSTSIEQYTIYIYTTRIKVLPCTRAVYNFLFANSQNEN